MALALCGATMLFGQPALALYRGDEFEPRDYNLGDRFFINRTTYYPSPDLLDRFELEAGGAVNVDQSRFGGGYLKVFAGF